MKKSRAARNQPKSKPAQSASGQWAVVVLCLIIFCVAAIRMRLLSMPLDRDEGEYAYAGQLMLDGIPPYQLAYNVKLPGSYAAYAVIMAVFGQSSAGIHFGFLLVNVGSIVLLYFIARHFLGLSGSLAACATFGLLSTSPAVFGLEGHATHLVTLGALGGFWLLLKARESGRMAVLYWSGTLFGLSFLGKQPGIFFGIFGGLILLRDALKTRPVRLWKTALFSLGCITPFALTCLLLWWAGSFPQFWHWTVTYARIHGSALSPHQAWERLYDTIIKHRFDGVFWLVAAAGAISLAVQKNRADRKFLLLGLLGFSFLAVCPGLYFSRHYFIVMLPVVGLLAGLAAETLAGWLKNWRALSWILFVSLCIGLTVARGNFWFKLSPTEACWNLYSGNPFLEAKTIADHIAENTPPNARVAILGSEPEIFFYAHRHSASGYIYMYDLMDERPEAHQMQLEMIHDIETVRPDYLVSISISTSWSAQEHSDHTLQAWEDKYVLENYQMDGMVVLWNEGPQIAWGKDAQAKVGNLSNCYLMIFKRK